VSERLQLVRCIHIGFGVIQATDYDVAVAIARACPPGYTIEIREQAGYA
jgi:hypothetical protein